jgi:hypothetical protein
MELVNEATKEEEVAKTKLRGRTALGDMNKRMSQAMNIFLVVISPEHGCKSTLKLARDATVGEAICKFIKKNPVM